jgi:hypothetical protein
VAEILVGQGLKTVFSSANGGGYVGNLKVLSEIYEALPPTGKSEFPPLATYFLLRIIFGTKIPPFKSPSKVLYLYGCKIHF